MAQIKVSDYISRFLVENGIKDLFLIPGGGMMHMLDSVSRQEGLNLVFNLNEQASGICAESYAQYTNRLGACLLTTGPGATNAVTGCAGAWTDSTPTLFISGQVKTQTIGYLKKLRYYGAQEISIIPMVEPITKYAKLIENPMEIRYHLEKAVYLAQHGRKGPVWLDVPLDVQGAMVEEDDLKGFSEQEYPTQHQEIEQKQIEEIYKMLNRAQRPAILMGHGIVSGGAQDTIRQLARKWNVPVLATWRAKGIFGDEDPLFMGSPGVPAPRYSNYVLQNSDFLLILGTRLNPAITAYQENHFAPLAEKVMVDIDEEEMKKLSIPLKLSIVADAGKVVQELLDNTNLFNGKDYTPWLDFCNKVKAKYPLSKEVQPLDNEGKVDGYYFAEKLSGFANKEDVFVGSSSGRTCGISHMAFRLQEGQKFISSMGVGAMGWCMPSAIACAKASGKRTLVLEGDGSLQSNIQELALLNTYQLPVKLFIWSNRGYASIYTMQKNNFAGEYAGCDPESGLQFPPIKEIAKAYNLPYYEICSNVDVEPVLAQIMQDDKPMICEVVGSLQFDEIPKSMTIIKPDGSFESSRLETLYPFLPQDEEEKNMPKWSKE